MCGFVQTIAALALLAGAVSCSPPPATYPYTPRVEQRRATLKDHLLLLLPEPGRRLPAAQEEAAWLADTAYKAAAGISRVNDSRFPGWAGNALINMRLQDRGLCWHYQHDMYRELRRRPLRFFRIGCCVRDKGRLTEHNCVYLAAANGEWPNGWVLDAWMWNGRLKVNPATALDKESWADLPEICELLSLFYAEGHGFPVEHWLSVRCYNGEYRHYGTWEARHSAQYRRMYENIERGKAEHPASPANY